MIFKRSAGFCLLTIFLMVGCSDIQVPTFHEAMTHPLGTKTLFKRGTSKAQVLKRWGEPSIVISHGVDELGSACEEWIYNGWLQGLPIDYEYATWTKHLFFEGDNLVRWTTEAPSQRAKEKEG